MKKLLSLSLFLFIVCIAFGQTNLQFSKVITYAGTLTLNTSTSSELWAVPAGKVWKVESMTTNQQYIANSGQITMNFNLNSTKIKQYNNTNSSGSLSSQIENLSPLWLKAGDTIQFTSNTNLSATYSCNYYISILEFNLAQ
jgi:hypothetical protein